MRLRQRGPFPPVRGTGSNLAGTNDADTMGNMSASEQPLLEVPRAGELHVDQLEDADRELLNAVQWDFPLEPRPYAVLAERLGADEANVRARVARVKHLGVLRQLSAIFDTRALGYGSSLEVAKIDPDPFGEAAVSITSLPGWSQKYNADPAYNPQLKIAGPPSRPPRAPHARRPRTPKQPTTTTYNTCGGHRNMRGHPPADARADVEEHERPERREHMEAPELSDLEVAAIRVSQADLPLVERPFAVEAESIGTDEEKLLGMLRSFKERKLMRRFAAVLNPPRAGYKANAVGVWAVPDERLEEMGPRMAGFAFVSHCYRRPTYEDWPYSVFTMVHGHNARDCEQTIAAIEAETGVDDYALLWSIKEYKKTRVRYFTAEWDEWRRENLTPASG